MNARHSIPYYIALDSLFDQKGAELCNIPGSADINKTNDEIGSFNEHNEKNEEMTYRSYLDRRVCIIHGR